ncbi:hypothetical protein EHP00_68 [Ecytonucleospora hepatopenaei]|uniref:Uncharacterized protein n=1 Tax=Ecytonucleospora hepatopenaei TaxID=646526 RepID=A0A1W0E5N3_9MICR|nr:hypothetical protein EHP00_68 [Ecytonucleospora hepatopenaei]
MENQKVCVGNTLESNKTGAIVDIVLTPYIDVCLILKQFSRENSLFIIDTTTNFFSELPDYVDDINNCIKTQTNLDNFNTFPSNDSFADFDINTQLEENVSFLKIFPCQSINKLLNIFRKLKNIMKGHLKCILLIDSICFVVDRQPFLVKQIMNEIWEVVYETKCTVFLINYLKISFDSGKAEFVPRMGEAYGKLVTNRVFVNKNEDLCDIAQFCP